MFIFPLLSVPLPTLNGAPQIRSHFNTYLRLSPTGLGAALERVEVAAELRYCAVPLRRTRKGIASDSLTLPLRPAWASHGKTLLGLVEQETIELRCDTPCI